MTRFFAHAAQLGRRVLTNGGRTRILWVAAGVFVLFLIPQAAHAGILDGVLSVISHVLYFLINITGKVTVLLFGILVQVAQYNDFINAEVVTIGWRIIRDVANMLFILVLLVIAFGTVFRIQQYRYQALLRQLIIMAVLINFSKTITGFFIDFSQVLMLTFVNAFADTAAGNLTTALGLDKILAIDTSVVGDQISNLSVAGTLFVGLVMIVVTTIVTGIYVVIFLARIIFLWILTVLSPLAYLFSTFPATKSYSSQWWRMFWQYAMVGPVLAFFLWLTLTVTAAGNAALLLRGENMDLTNASEFESGGKVTAAISIASSQTGILSFLIATMLLIYSLKLASTFSVAGGAWASGVGAGMTAKGVRAITAPARWGGALAAGVAGGVAGGLYGATLKKPAEWVAEKGTAAMARIPLVGNVGERLNARFNTYKKKRQEKYEQRLGTVSDSVLAARANSVWWSPDAVQKRKIAQKLHPGSIRDDTIRDKVLRDMVPADFRAVRASRLFSLAEKLQARGQHITGAYPDLARAIIQGGTVAQKRALGLVGVDWVRPTPGRPARPATATRPAQPAQPPTPGRFVSPSGMAAMPTPQRPLADVDRRKYEDTKQVIDRQYGGDAEAFYKSNAYFLQPQAYLGKEEFEEALAIERDRERKRGRAEAKPTEGGEKAAEIQERERKRERGGARLSDLTGMKSARQHGKKGEAANLAIDFAEDELVGLALGNAAGANLTGAEQKVAAGVLSEKYKRQEEEKEVERRQRTIQEEADKAHEEERLAAARKGEIGKALPRKEITREEAQAAVKADAAFQENLTRDTGDFREALENAESINLINKGRTGRSARQVLRHEQAHDAVELIDEVDKEDLKREPLDKRGNPRKRRLDQMWEQLAPERRKEIEEFIRKTWTGGAQMSLEEIQHEYFTEAFASHGRGKQLGPLGLSDKRLDETERVIEERFRGNAKAFYASREYQENEAQYVPAPRLEQAQRERDIAVQLGGALNLSRQEQSRAEVDQLPEEGLRQFYNSLSSERRGEIGEFVRRTREGGGRYSEDDVMREFFSEALASHRGGEKEGPLGFTKEEQEMALLLHASAKGKVPQTAAPGPARAVTAPVSVAEVGRRPAAPPTVPPPPGAARVVAAPPSRIVERGVEAPISPVIQTNIIQNPSVQSVASEFSKRVAGKLETLPTRQDLLYSIQQLQNIVLQVARAQGIAEKDLRSVTTELDQLRAEVRSPSKRPEDQRALQANLQKFLKKFKTQQEEEESEEGNAANAA